MLANVSGCFDHCKKGFTVLFVIVGHNTAVTGIQDAKEIKLKSELILTGPFCPLGSTCGPIQDVYFSLICRLFQA